MQRTGARTGVDLFSRTYINKVTSDEQRQTHTSIVSACRVACVCQAVTCSLFLTVVCLVFGCRAAARYACFASIPSHSLLTFMLSAVQSAVFASLPLRTFFLAFFLFPGNGCAFVVQQVPKFQFYILFGVFAGLCFLTAFAFLLLRFVGCEKEKRKNQEERRHEERTRKA